VFSDGEQLGQTDRVCPCGVGDIDRVADGSFATSVLADLADLAVTGNGEVVDPLMGLAFLRLYFRANLLAATRSAPCDAKSPPPRRLNVHPGAFSRFP
jgi:hypothetical protein